ncbi:MAG: hypothetical protein WCG66_06170 [bacterium]
MQDSDSYPRRFGLPRFQGCAGRCGLLHARTGLPGYPSTLPDMPSPLTPPER